MSATEAEVNEQRVRHNRAEILKALHDPSASFWFTKALQTALMRDPVDAASDAEVLYKLLSERSRAVVEAELQRLGGYVPHTDSPWDDLKEP